MPYLPAAPCLACRRAPGVRRGRCLPCARAHDRARGSRQARGYDALHDRLRVLVLERDAYRCQLRLRRCLGLATSVDHIVPLSRGGRTELANLQAACRPCNSAKTGGRAPVGVAPNVHRPAPGGPRVRGVLSRPGFAVLVTHETDEVRTE